MSSSNNKKWQIFILGTNNWQGGGEFAPGSGILHEGHHQAFEMLMKSDNVSGVFSIWPSENQRLSEAQRNLPVSKLNYRIFELDHQIPICESVSPVSSYRWHSFSQEQFSAYHERLLKETEAFIDRCEAETKIPFNLFIAHHTFLNPIVMCEINRRRVARGLPSVPVIAFAHGTAMKMYNNELGKGEYPPEDYPKRFYPWVLEKGIFGADAAKSVSGVFAISKAQQDTFCNLFPDFPRDRVVIAPNGYNQKIFGKDPSASPASLFGGDKPTLLPKYYEGIEDEIIKNRKSIISEEEAKKIRERIAKFKSSGLDPSRFNCFIIMTGKLADWKRIDTVLVAAKQYHQEALRLTNGTKKICTVIVGGGPDAELRKLQNIAYVDQTTGGDDVLEHTFFLGPQPQDILNKLNNSMDLGLYPSKDEPFGLVFIEAMAAGLSVVGANSGGPRDFVTPEVGALIEESNDRAVLASRLSAVVIEACVTNNWKKEKGPAAEKYAFENFSLKAQCKQMLQTADSMFLQHCSPSSSKSKKCECCFENCSAMTLVGVAAAVALGIAFFMNRKSKI